MLSVLSDLFSSFFFLLVNDNDYKQERHLRKSLKKNSPLLSFGPPMGKKQPLKRKTSDFGRFYDMVCVGNEFSLFWKEIAFDDHPVAFLLMFMQDGKGQGINWLDHPKVHKEEKVMQSVFFFG